MQITPRFNYNINSINKCTGLSFKGTMALRCNYADSFEKSNIPQIKKYFHADNDVKLFKLLPKPVRDIKYKGISEDCKREAFNSMLAGSIIKRMYDEEYGKDNYVFVSIGTSPAGVGRALEFMGRDVRYLPISGFRQIGFPIENLTDYQDTDKYSKFLDEIGLNRKSVLSSGKKFIFSDYTHTGKSLNAVEYYAINRRSLPEEQLEFRSLNRDLAEYSKKHKKVTEKVLEYTDSLCNSKLSKYSGIPHVNCMVVDNIQEELKKPLNKNAKDFNFAMLYLLEEEGLLP